MPSIGPTIPPHLLSPQNTGDDSDSDGASDTEKAPVLGPQLPPGIGQSHQGDKASDDDDDDYAPALPPDMIATRSAGSASYPPSASTSKRSIGPSFSLYPPTDSSQYSAHREAEDDDDIGPRPLPSGVEHAEKDAVTVFLEREERRKKLAEEAKKPKVLKRDEWMLVPPSSSDLLGGLDPTKLKARQFSRSTAPANKVQDSSLWTETPAERQQRLADEVSGKKRRAVDAPVQDESEEAKRRKMEEEAIRHGVDEYTRKIRGPALIERHATSGKGDKDNDKDKEEGIWDHSRDMSIGGRLMDDSKRKQLIKEARGLDSRFGKGTSGGFL